MRRWTAFEPMGSRADSHIVLAFTATWKYPIFTVACDNTFCSGRQFLGADMLGRNRFVAADRDQAGSLSTLLALIAKRVSFQP
jgi:hypothetical protein